MSDIQDLLVVAFAGALWLAFAAVVAALHVWVAGILWGLLSDWIVPVFLHGVSLFGGAS